MQHTPLWRYKFRILRIKKTRTKVGTLRISHKSLKLLRDIPSGSFTESDLRKIGAITRGTLGGYPIPQYRTKKWQIPKYRVAHRLNTDTAYFNYIYNRFRILMVNPSIAFNYLRHLCTKMSMFFFNILVVRKFFANLH